MTIMSSATSGIVRRFSGVAGTASAGSRPCSSNPRRSQFQASADRHSARNRHASGMDVSTCWARTPRNAAKANPSIFYDRQGHARTVSDVYHVLVARYDVARAAPPVSANATATAAAPLDPARSAPATTAAPSAVPVAANGAAPVTPAPGPSFRSLFSDSDRAPVSRYVRDLWTTDPRVAAALTGQAAPPPVEPAPQAAPQARPQSAPSAPVSLFSDQPSDVRSLFGQGS